ncbi:tetratricopeptide repeat protein [Flavobacterium branchiicola]|uniref:Tetratricopeptide repeat protein n=1 Tax=Flavobacterium branchiicola TaxID=1114875 RepID=A0ABV9PFF6_9FLAO|nr:tetratricopeptide repeat protein [Flavobacterium branchiicola]MBS7254528.1 tetratricopeptide repeat protein [Flavobacterium branchiicola]
MKNYFIVLIILLSFKTFAQKDPKTAFQQSRYELAVSCYKKDDLKKALDLFSVASRIKPENDLGKESTKQVDAIKTILRKNMMDQVLGTWRMTGDNPVWSQAATTAVSQSETEEIVEITAYKILFYEVNKKTKAKKMTSSEDLKYYNKDASDALFSDIILSDGTIWNCLLGENGDVLRVINIAKKTETGVEIIKSDNIERYFVKVK